MQVSHLTGSFPRTFELHHNTQERPVGNSDSVLITDLTGLHRKVSFVHSPNRPVRTHALTMGLPPRNEPRKGGCGKRVSNVGCKPGSNAGCTAPLISPAGPGPQAGTSFSPPATSFPPTPSLLSPSLSLFLPPRKRASGFWLPLPGNQMGCHRLGGIAQMLPNEGAEMRGRHLCL